MGGQDIRFYMRVRAPSIYQANGDEFAQIEVEAKSTSDPAIQSVLTTLTKMDVVHGINLDTSHSMADIEQGQSAIFSITITNTGNVYDSFIFWDPSTLEGQTEWVLPFGWQVNFPTSVSLDPGQSITKNLEVSVPTTEDPGLFVIYLKDGLKVSRLNLYNKVHTIFWNCKYSYRLDQLETLFSRSLTRTNMSCRASVQPTRLKSPRTLILETWFSELQELQRLSPMGVI